MMSLGTLLVKHGWITKLQLGLAISKQREVGGRLGTCLLEMGALAEDLLDRSLAEQQGVPSAGAEDLRDIPAKVVRLLPAPIAIRYRAIPFRASTSDVDVAMLEVDNLWLQDELSFIVGRSLNVYIANEARMVEALGRYYKAPCSERFQTLLERLDRERALASETTIHPESRLMHGAESVGGAPSRTTGADGGTAGGPVVEIQAHRSRTLASRPQAQPGSPRRSIPVTVQELSSLEAAPNSGAQTDSPPVSAEPYVRDTGAGPLPSLEDAEAAIEAASEPEEVGRLLVAALSRLLTRVVLLKVSAGRVRGWLAEGPGLDEARLADFEVEFDQPSIFLNLRGGGSFFLGTLPEMPAHLELMACWHKDLSDECVVFPVRVRERLVALTYGDCGPLGLAELDLDRMRALCTAAARAFESCIVERKKRHRTAAERARSG